MFNTQLNLYNTISIKIFPEINISDFISFLFFLIHVTQFVLKLCYVVKDVFILLITLSSALKC